jgi:thiol-disulfide isomerase/thioredoxin
MLNFWASWCGPCRFEMPFIQEVFEDTEWEATGLVILAVNIGESPSIAGGFMEDNGFTFTVLLDGTGEVADMYNTRSIPATFFIDENGIIRYIDVGAFSSKANIEQRLDVLIEDESQGS